MVEMRKCHGFSSPPQPRQGPASSLSRRLPPSRLHRAPGGCLLLGFSCLISLDRRLQGWGCRSSHLRAPPSSPSHAGPCTRGPWPCGHTRVQERHGREPSPGTEVIRHVFSAPEVMFVFQILPTKMAWAVIYHHNVMSYFLAAFMTKKDSRHSSHIMYQQTPA